ncbi:hypothetical protein ACKC9G_18270 [Pokkaliibacter sp. CJK22405]|uniref:hypothetical protein n=1 Tax=Pokkaliibacter sp. CJK22405 TaxID=3384615 RepID=UPI003984E521
MSHEHFDKVSDAEPSLTPGPTVASYTISEGFIRHQLRNILIFTFVLGLLGFGAVYLALKAQTQMWIFAAMTFWLAWHKFQHRRYWQKDARELSLNLTEDHLEICRQGEVRKSLQIEGLVKITEQRKWGRLDSLLLKDSSGQQQRLRGFDRLEELEQGLLQRQPAITVTKRYLLHR